MTDKCFSVIGDSISAFAGTIPQNNKAYYTGANAGVCAPEEMWWAVMAKALDMRPLVIEGWSGSCVTANTRPDTLEASNTRRCQSLGAKGRTPDIVLTAMGVNDYSYNAPLGEWDENAEDTTAFRPAYGAMLRRIKHAYPHGLIVCITPWFMQRGRDTGTTYVNDMGLTAADYARAVEEVAGCMGCPVIRGDGVGFDRSNFYPRYCVDSDVIPTHPNAAGHRQMGLYIARELLKLI